MGGRATLTADTYSHVLADPREIHRTDVDLAVMNSIAGFFEDRAYDQIDASRLRGRGRRGRRTRACLSGRRPPAQRGGPFRRQSWSMRRSPSRLPDDPLPSAIVTSVFANAGEPLAVRLDIRRVLAYAVGQTRSVGNAWETWALQWLGYAYLGLGDRGSARATFGELLEISADAGKTVRPELAVAMGGLARSVEQGTSAKAPGWRERSHNCATKLAA